MAAKGQPQAGSSSADASGRDSELVTAIISDLAGATAPAAGVAAAAALPPLAGKLPAAKAKVAKVRRAAFYTLTSAVGPGTRSCAVAIA